jgi:hypothetical protein
VKKAKAGVLQIFENPHTSSEDHSYVSGCVEGKEISVAKGKHMRIVFNPQTSTYDYFDYITFYVNDKKGAYYGRERYTGGSDSSPKLFPGVGSEPALVIPSHRCYLYFYSTGTIR